MKRAGPSPSGHSLAIQGIFPWCFTPELYAAKPDYIESLAAFVRGRPPQSLEAFLQQSNAIIGHDAESQLGKIAAPTQIRQLGSETNLPRSDCSYFLRDRYFSMSFGSVKR